MYTFFTDSDTDVSKKIVDSYGAKMISMPYAYGDKTVYPYVDFDEFDCHEFYDMLRGGVLPSTSAISEESYYNYFKPEFQDGKDILYVHFSAAMTATFNNMHKALERLYKEFPDRKFFEIDTLGITTISYGIVMELLDMYKAGKTAEELVKWAETEVQHFAMYFFADDLKFFRKSGRVGGLAATVGGIIGIRPIIYMSSEGKMESIGKEKGRFKAIDRLVSYVEELGDDIKSHRIVVGHTDSPELADDVITKLKERFGDDLNIEVVPANPTAGSHCGPNGVGICFHAIHR